mgnify:CR=1 FL=1
MIETKNRNSVPYMRETWKKGLPNVDPRFMEYFFGYVYKPEYGYYLMEEDEVKGSLCCIPHAYMFNGRVLQAVHSRAPASHASDTWDHETIFPLWP